MKFNKHLLKEKWFAYTFAACSAVILYLVLTHLGVLGRFLKSVWKTGEGNPAARVNVQKQRKIWQTACHFLHTHREEAPRGFDQPCRFDVLTARMYQTPVQFAHIKNAFEGTQVIPQC